MQPVSPEEYGGRALGLSPEMAFLFERTAVWQAVIEEFIETMKLLAADAARGATWHNRYSKDHYWRRIVVKNAFTWFEGQAFMMKRVALHRHEHFEIEFSAAELAMLREDKYSLNDKGQAITGDNYPNFISNYKFSFGSFAKAHASTFLLNATTIDRLKTLKKVRDRLTHPKQLLDLQVTDDELKLAEQATNTHINDSTAALKLAGKPNTQESRQIWKLTSRFNVSMPVMMFWRDGSAFEFQTKKAARQFAQASRRIKEKRDFLVYNLRDLETAARTT